jgi:hypothetical protein
MSLETNLDNSGIISLTTQSFSKEMKFAYPRKDIEIREIRLNLVFDIISKDVSCGEPAIISQMSYNRELMFNGDIDDSSKIISSIFEVYVGMLPWFKGNAVHIKSTVFFERNCFLPDGNFVSLPFTDSHEVEANIGSKKLS